MNTLGQRIRELRRRNDLTQEKLADLLGVTYQSVSKWECGVTSPDLSLIGPLTRLLHVTSDELLGLNQPVTDARRMELEEACRTAWRDGGERDGFRLLYTAQETLVREYPGDMKYLCDFAWTESNRAWNLEDREVFRAEQEKAVRHFTLVIENTDDERLKCNAIEGITQVLGFLGRYDEAKTYIALLPDAPYRTKEQLLENLLQGEDLRRHRQRRLEGQLHALLHTMLCCSSDSWYAVTLAEEILTKFFPDGNYLGFHETMYELQHRKALLLLQEKRYDEAVRALELYKKHAALADETERRTDALRYTPPFFDLLTEDPYPPEETDWSGNPTHTEAFVQNLADGCYDPLRDRADFQVLMG
ncbi:MAG: helix-turn-helix domain-containing protein [Eubacteriales bacterium]